MYEVLTEKTSKKITGKSVSVYNFFRLLFGGR